MKKKMKELLKLALMAVMAFTLVACGSDEESKDSNKDKSEKVTKEEAKTEEVTTEDKGTALEQFVSSEAFQSQIKSELDKVNSDELSMEVLAEGNKLIYIYTYKLALDDATIFEQMKSALATSLDTQKQVFVGLATSMNTQLKVKDTEVVVRYQDVNKKVIYEASFKAE